MDVFLKVFQITFVRVCISLNINDITHTRRYGPLRGPTSSSCGLLRPLAEAFFALRAKKGLFYAVLAHFWCPVVTMVTFSSNISNNEKQKKNPKISKNFKKFQKIPKSKKHPNKVDFPDIIFNFSKKLMCFSFHLMHGWRAMVVMVYLAPIYQGHSVSVQCYEFCLHAILLK